MVILNNQPEQKGEKTMPIKNQIELERISTPKYFSKDEYVCYEGQWGKEMYVVLRGSIGVFITSVLGNLTKVAEIGEGQFFGEMAIFDKAPRSASCIALEDTVCIAIDKSNLQRFLETCPDMAEIIMSGMSNRIRKLNEELYKRSQNNKKKKAVAFSLPPQFNFSHNVKEPVQDPKFIQLLEQPCPVCNGMVTAKTVRKNMLQIRETEETGRAIYYNADPLWLQVTRCQHCTYSNLTNKFFNIDDSEVDRLKIILKTQHALVIKNNAEVLKSSFDNVILAYLQAIHINETINPDDKATIGMLWLNLHFACKDAGDIKLSTHCARNAIKKLRSIIDDDLIIDLNEKAQISLYVASLLKLIGQKASAEEYCDVAIESAKDSSIKNRAEKFKTTL